MPTCWIIAGPNGAGKTTFALGFLPEVVGCRQFINADLIAAGLSPLAPEAERIAASRLFLSEIQTAILAGNDFSFETTLSGRSHLQLIHRLRQHDWEVELIYLALPSVELSKLRVAERVAHGGHDIPIADIERRFPRSLQNLFGEYGEASTRVRCFMNDSECPELIYEQSADGLTIIHEAHFSHLKKESQA